MKDLNLEIFEKVFKKNRIFLIVSLILLLGSFSFIYLGYKEQTKKIPNAINMNSLLESEVKEEDIAYIEVNQIPFLFAVYETDGKEGAEKFYLTMDKDDYLYIVYMNDKTYKKLNKENIQEKPIRIDGYLQKIDNEIKDLAISSYNKELGEEYLTTDNFSEYVGTYLLDTVTPLTNPYPYYIVASFIFFLFLIFFISYLVSFLKTKKVIKKYSTIDLHKIEAEIYALGENPYEKMHLYLTKNYLIDASSGIVILEYKDIIWAYPYEYRYNGLLVNKDIKILTKNHKYYDICNTKYLKDKKEETIEEVLKILEKNNPKIVVGYSKEIKKQILKKQKNKDKA